MIAFNLPVMSGSSLSYHCRSKGTLQWPFCPYLQCPLHSSCMMIVLDKVMVSTPWPRPCATAQTIYFAPRSGTFTHCFGSDIGIPKYCWSLLVLAGFQARALRLELLVKIQRSGKTTRYSSKSYICSLHQIKLSNVTLVFLDTSLAQQFKIR